MAAKGGKFIVRDRNSGRTVTSKPTDSGYKVTDTKGGRAHTVPVGPTTITTKENGVVVDTTTASSPSAAAQKSARRVAHREAQAKKRRTRAILSSGKTGAKKASQKVKSPKPYTPPKFPKSKPQKFGGLKTAGTPTREELKGAAYKGTLKLNKAGAVTTPKVRVAARRLKKAKRAVARTAPKLTGDLTPQEAKFAETVAKKTPLKPATVAAWTKLEGGNSTGDFNRLNVGHTDSGPLPLTEDPRWRNPKSAGNLTAKFLKGQYGGASSGIQAVLPEAKGKSPSQQLHVIAKSGWATDPAYDSKLQSTLSSVGEVKTGPHAKKARKELKAAEGQAKKVGLTPKTSSAGPPPKKVVTRYKASVAAEKQLEKAHLPYVWGGGHTAGKVEPGSGLDCSGTVSYVLQHMGVKLPGGVVSGEMGSYLKPGPGAVTVFYNGEHTFLYDAKAGKYFGTSASNPGGGAGFFPKSVGDAEVAEGNSAGAYQVGHVPGLGKKQAIQLGAIPGSFPGMSLSSSGTTATIEQGAGATVETPGFSSKPIKLTPRQKVNRAERKLKALSSPQTPKESSSTTLDALEKKYASAAP